MVGENGPELEYTQPSRIYSNPQSGGMLGAANAELVAEVRELRNDLHSTQLQMIKLTSQNASDTRRIRRLQEEEAEAL